MKSIRITVSGRNLKFLQELSEQMDEPNLAAVMTYLLTDIRGLKYRFGDKPAPVPQQAQAPIGYAFDTSTFEPAFAPIPNNQNAVDPTIQRLIDAGLEMEF
ncbi:MAG: hypothetical protein KME38_25255 [Spirirestis rafaelensis WJT71-NPBG6]|nr:hypothetical protein [Spirirestis rafaelensis WJT71-NPBG6]